MPTTSPEIQGAGPLLFELGWILHYCSSNKVATSQIHHIAHCQGDTLPWSYQRRIE
jgi:hypothetical protein